MEIRLKFFSIISIPHSIKLILKSDMIYISHNVRTQTVVSFIYADKGCFVAPNLNETKEILSF